MTKQIEKDQTDTDMLSINNKKVSEKNYVMPFMDMWKLKANTWKIMLNVFINQRILIIGT